MGRADYLAPGDWNAVCYECGRKRKASMLKKHWQGYYVCPEHWEPRHPQDFVRNVPDNMTVPWAQPMPAPIFVPSVLSVTLIDRVIVSDSDFLGDYVDPTYFLEDYISDYAWTLYVQKPLTDSVTLASAGTLTIPPYVDPTYFAADYITSGITSFT